MPSFSIDMKTGKFEPKGEITSVTVNQTGAISKTETVDNGVTTTVITFKNGGTVSSTPHADGSGFSISAKGVLLTYSDDPNKEGGIVVKVKMDESVE